mmetsp:Transcript_55614/g.172907  ORF Transcript_55614/g.172907 Transcript_55614/m.172907 type:complete len:202 (-) Transcript_55614:93-698(-)
MPPPRTRRALPSKCPPVAALSPWRAKRRPGHGGRNAWLRLHGPRSLTARCGVRAAAACSETSPRAASRAAAGAGRGRRRAPRRAPAPRHPRALRRRLPPMPRAVPGRPAAGVPGPGRTWRGQPRPTRRAPPPGARPPRAPTASAPRGRLMAWRLDGLLVLRLAKERWSPSWQLEQGAQLRHHGPGKQLCHSHVSSASGFAT